MSNNILIDSCSLSVVEHSCPISVGELIQGKIRWNDSLVNFLVSVPVQCCRTVKISKSHVAICSSKYLKAYKAINMLKKEFGVKDYFSIEIDSPLDIVPSKGFSTSSADIIATCRAFFKMYGLPDNDSVILNVLRNIERSDPVLYIRPSVFLQSECVLIDFIKIPNLQFIVIDDGGYHDTKSTEVIYSQDEIENFENMVKVLLSKNGPSITQVYEFSKQSALINQRVLNKSSLAEIIEVSEMFNVGVNVAHSGTVVSLYFPVNGSSDSITDLIMKEIKIRGFNIHSCYRSIEV